MGSLSSHSDCQRSHAILAGNPEGFIVQDVVNEVAHFEQVRVRESRQEMVRQVLYAAAGAQEDRRCLLERTNENCALRSDNFGAHVIAVNGLLVRLDVANRTALELKIDNACDHVTVLGNLRSNCDCSVCVNLGNFITHQPAGQIKVMNSVGVEQHAVYVRLEGGNWRSVFVTSYGLE